MTSIDTPTTTKQAVLDLVAKLPNDVTLDDIMEELYVRQKIEIGLQQLDSGQGISHTEAQERLAKWLK